MLHEKKQQQRKSTNLFLLLEEENLKFVWQFLQQQQKKSQDICCGSVLCATWLHDSVCPPRLSVCLWTLSKRWRRQAKGDRRAVRQTDGRTAIWVASSNGCHLSFVYICRLNEICIEWLEKKPKTNWKIACIYRKADDSNVMTIDGAPQLIVASQGVVFFYLYKKCLLHWLLGYFFGVHVERADFFWKVKLNIHYYSWDEF